ncbi:MAG: hypothetical protein ACE5OR_10060 [bacterium]
MTQLIIGSKNKNLVPLLNGAVKNELRVIDVGISKTQRNLKDFEKKFRTTSEEFYQQFQKGEMGDSEDFVRWAGEYETLKKLLQDRKLLAGAEIC